jgi:hypothetical protein
MPAEWSVTMLILASPVLPSDEQLATALAGTRITPAECVLVSLDGLSRRLQQEHPDVVLVATRGPVVRVVVRAVAQVPGPRPVLLSGLPGLTIPAARKAIAYRAQTDLIVLHSRREVRDFTALADTMGLQQRFGLARLPFIPDADAIGSGGSDIVFAAQAKVPTTKEDRLLLLGWLAETARRHPDRRVVVKLRARVGEQQTHTEAFGYAELIPELDPPAPANLVVEGGPMAEHLARAGALVTVSSTAVIEAAALGIPGLVLTDFGVSRRMINLVFVGSGLLGDHNDLIDARFGVVDPGWREDNYMHSDDGGAGWLELTRQLIDQQAAQPAPLKRQRIGRLGGGLRRAWDRKSVLGAYDTTVSGYLALAIGTPARWVVRRVRRITRPLRQRRAVRDEVESEAVDVSRDLQGV